MAQKYKAQPYGYPPSLQYKNGKKQKTLALNNKERGKAKSTQKKQKHTYLTNGQTYISNTIHWTMDISWNCFNTDSFLSVSLKGKHAAHLA